MLFRAAFLFMELNALLASTSKIPSVAGCLWNLCSFGLVYSIDWVRQRLDIFSVCSWVFINSSHGMDRRNSIPPGIPAHVWIGAVLLISSDLSTLV